MKARLITFQGETKSLSQWSRVFGLSVPTLKARLDDLNWTIEEAFSSKKERVNGINKFSDSPLFRKTYLAWRDMNRRCEDQSKIKNRCYKGITVCDQWKTDFDFFLKDMGLAPFKRAQIDRIDGEQGYIKENCRWVTPRQNNLNRRNVIRLTYQGKTLYLDEWAKQLDVCKMTLYQRLYVLKWPIERALTGKQYRERA